ncbi:MAG: VOC family protein [Alphaproteobacteria bacterium]|nr:VOC family protein [Alphaproteobacteria bacterium]
MIDELDHLVIGGSAGVYETLLGRRATDGRLRTGNVGLAFAEGTPGLQSMAFATDDVGKAATLLERRAVVATREGDAVTLTGHGVAIRLAAKGSDAPSPFTGDEAACVSTLDHVVVRTANPERAVAFYGGRLGLDLRLDRSNEKWGARQLFFRCGDVVVEIVHELKKGVSEAPDQLWGLAWRVPDIGKAHARLEAAGLDVNAPRDGRRPGSQVFSVKNKTCGVPTLVIGGIGRW